MYIRLHKESGLTEWERKSEAIRYYDVTASIYDVRYEEEQKIKIEAALRNVDLESTASVLDIGCGTGLLLEYVSRAVEIVVAVDFSKKIMAIARQRTCTSNNVHFILADADNLPLKNNAFSHLFLITILQNAPEVFRTLTEARRVARNNAWIAATGLKKKFREKILKQLLTRSGLQVSYLDGSNANFLLAVCRKGLHQI